MPLFKLNEGLETVAHNAIGNFLMGDHTLGTKKWISAIDPRLIPGGFRDRHDQEYFRKYYRITPAVESKLRKMIEGIPNIAMFGKQKVINQMIYSVTSMDLMQKKKINLQCI